MLLNVCAFGRQQRLSLKRGGEETAADVNAFVNVRSRRLKTQRSFSCGKNGSMYTIRMTLMTSQPSNYFIHLMSLFIPNKKDDYENKRRAHRNALARAFQRPPSRPFRGSFISTVGQIAQVFLFLCLFFTTLIIVNSGDYHHKGIMATFAAAQTSSFSPSPNFIRAQNNKDQFHPPRSYFQTSSFSSSGNSLLSNAAHDNPSLNDYNYAENEDYAFASPLPLGMKVLTLGYIRMSGVDDPSTLAGFLAAIRAENENNNEKEGFSGVYGARTHGFVIKLDVVTIACENETACARSLSSLEYNYTTPSIDRMAAVYSEYLLSSAEGERQEAIGLADLTVNFTTLPQDMHDGEASLLAFFARMPFYSAVIHPNVLLAPRVLAHAKRIGVPVEESLISSSTSSFSDYSSNLAPLLTDVANGGGGEKDFANSIRLEQLIAALETAITYNASHCNVTTACDGENTSSTCATPETKQRKSTVINFYKRQAMLRSADRSRRAALVAKQKAGRLGSPLSRSISASTTKSALSGRFIPIVAPITFGAETSDENASHYDDDVEGASDAEEHVLHFDHDVYSQLAHLFTYMQQTSSCAVSGVLYQHDLLPAGADSPEIMYIQSLFVEGGLVKPPAISTVVEDLDLFRFMIKEDIHRRCFVVLTTHNELMKTIERLIVLVNKNSTITGNTSNTNFSTTSSDMLLNEAEGGKKIFGTSLLSANRFELGGRLHTSTSNSSSTQASATLALGDEQQEVYQRVLLDSFAIDIYYTRWHPEFNATRTALYANSMRKATGVADEEALNEFQSSVSFDLIEAYWPWLDSIIVGENRCESSRVFSPTCTPPPLYSTSEVFEGECMDPVSSPHFRELVENLFNSTTSTLNNSSSSSSNDDKSAMNIHQDRSRRLFASPLNTLLSQDGSGRSTSLSPAASTSGSDVDAFGFASRAEAYGTFSAFAREGPNDAMVAAFLIMRVTLDTIRSAVDRVGGAQRLHPSSASMVIELSQEIEAAARERKRVEENGNCSSTDFAESNSTTELGGAQASCYFLYSSLIPHNSSGNINDHTNIFDYGDGTNRSFVPFAVPLLPLFTELGSNCVMCSNGGDRNGSHINGTHTVGKCRYYTDYNGCANNNSNNCSGAASPLSSACGGGGSCAAFLSSSAILIAQALPVLCNATNNNSTNSTNNTSCELNSLRCVRARSVVTPAVVPREALIDAFYDVSRSVGDYHFGRPQRRCSPRPLSSSSQVSSSSSRCFCNVLPRTSYVLSVSFPAQKIPLSAFLPSAPSKEGGQSFSIATCGSTVINNSSSENGNASTQIATPSTSPHANSSNLNVSVVVLRACPIVRYDDEFLGQRDAATMIVSSSGDDLSASTSSTQQQRLMGSKKSCGYRASSWSYPMASLLVEPPTVKEGSDGLYFSIISEMLGELTRTANYAPHTPSRPYRFVPFIADEGETTAAILRSYTESFNPFVIYGSLQGDIWQASVLTLYPNLLFETEDPVLKPLERTVVRAAIGGANASGVRNEDEFKEGLSADPLHYWQPNLLRLQPVLADYIHATASYYAQNRLKLFEGMPIRCLTSSTREAELISLSFGTFGYRVDEIVISKDSDVWAAHVTKWLSYEHPEGYYVRAETEGGGWNGTNFNYRIPFVFAASADNEDIGFVYRAGFTGIGVDRGVIAIVTSDLIVYNATASINAAGGSPTDKTYPTRPNKSVPATPSQIADLIFPSAAPEWWVPESSRYEGIPDSLSKYRNHPGFMTALIGFEFAQSLAAKAENNVLLTAASILYNIMPTVATRLGSFGPFSDAPCSESVIATNTRNRQCQCTKGPRTIYLHSQKDAETASFSYRSGQYAFTMGTCGVVYVPPPPELGLANAFSLSGGAIAGVTIGSVIIFAAFIAGGFLLFNVFFLQRSHRNAPTNPEMPFAIVFSDIQASTALWARAPAAMSKAVDDHHRIIRKALRANSGYEVKTVGDSFMVAFKSVDDAVQFSLEVQIDLFSADCWGTEIDAIYLELLAEQQRGRRGGRGGDDAGGDEDKQAYHPFAYSYDADADNNININTRTFKKEEGDASEIATMVADDALVSSGDEANTTNKSKWYSNNNNNNNFNNGEVIYSQLVKNGQRFSISDSLHFVRKEADLMSRVHNVPTTLNNEFVYSHSPQNIDGMTPVLLDNSASANAAQQGLIDTFRHAGGAADNIVDTSSHHHLAFVSPLFGSPSSNNHIGNSNNKNATAGVCDWQCLGGSYSTAQEASAYGSPRIANEQNGSLFNHHSDSAPYVPLGASPVPQPFIKSRGDSGDDPSKTKVSARNNNSNNLGTRHVAGDVDHPMAPDSSRPQIITQHNTACTLASSSPFTSQSSSALQSPTHAIRVDSRREKHEDHHENGHGGGNEDEFNDKDDPRRKQETSGPAVYRLLSCKEVLSSIANADGHGGTLAEEFQASGGTVTRPAGGGGGVVEVALGYSYSLPFSGIKRVLSLEGGTSNTTGHRDSGTEQQQQQHGRHNRMASQGGIQHCNSYTNNHHNNSGRSPAARHHYLTASTASSMDAMRLAARNHLSKHNSKIIVSGDDGCTVEIGGGRRRASTRDEAGDGHFWCPIHSPYGEKGRLVPCAIRADRQGTIDGCCCNPTHDQLLFRKNDVEQNPIDTQPAECKLAVSEASWHHGLRVRIGVHYGMGDIRKDPVSLGYDYYGTVVNTAARVEGVGHGGQILVTEDAFSALSDDYIPSSKAVVVCLGPQPLRGLDEAIKLYQLVPESLHGRRFPPLRLNIEKATEDEHDTLTATAENSSATAKTESTQLPASVAIEDLAKKMCSSPPFAGVSAAQLALQTHFFISAFAPAPEKFKLSALVQLGESWGLEKPSKLVRDPVKRQRFVLALLGKMIRTFRASTTVKGAAQFATSSVVRATAPLRSTLSLCSSSNAPMTANNAVRNHRHDGRAYMSSVTGGFDNNVALLTDNSSPRSASAAK